MHERLFGSVLVVWGCAVQCPHLHCSWTAVGPHLDRSWTAVGPHLDRRQSDSGVWASWGRDGMGWAWGMGMGAWGHGDMGTWEHGGKLGIRIRSEE